MALQLGLRPNPLLAISAPLLLFLTKASPSLQSKVIPKSLSRAGIIKFLSISVALGVVGQVSKLFSAWAKANWLWGRGRGIAFGEQGWDKEVAVVTGGSNGMGALIAKGLAEKGIRVAILDLVEPKDEIDGISYFSCDITSPKAVKEVAAAVKSYLGPPSILINNAGIAYAHTCLDTTPLQLRKLFDVNVLSHYFTIQAFLPHMIEKKKGHIIATCSMATFTSPAELVDYAATKSAVYSIYEGLREELKYRYDAPEVQLTTVHPTYVNTTLIGPYAKSLEKSKALVIEPETVANAVVNQILSGQGDRICLPNYLSILTLARGLPAWFGGLIGYVTQNDIRAEIKIPKQ